MMPKTTKGELQDFALEFDDKVVKPLLEAGFERNKYNVFNILNISRQELRHSDFLAFLLNPSQSGDIGQQFLRNFLALLAKDLKEPSIDFFKMYYGTFNNVLVRCEVAVKSGERIDILVDLPVEKIVIVIENKVDSSEHDDQLGKYKRFIDSEHRYKDFKKIFLFLSPDKTPPRDKGWLAIDYNLIYSVLCRINTDTADNTVQTLVKDYKKLLRSEFEMNDEDKIRSAAREIYRNNPDIFDTIFKYKPDRLKETSKLICNFLRSKEDYEPGSDKETTNIIFRTKELANYRNIYFQIEVRPMLLYFYLDGGSDIEKAKLGKADNNSRRPTIFPQKCLFNDTRKLHDEMITKHENLLKENRKDAEAEFNADIESMLEKMHDWILKHSSDVYRRLNENV